MKQKDNLENSKDELRVEDIRFQTHFLDDISEDIRFEKQCVDDICKLREEITFEKLRVEDIPFGKLRVEDITFEKLRVDNIAKETTPKEDFTTSLKHIKEKYTDAEGDTTGRNSAQKSTKTIAALKDTRTSKGGFISSKDERKCSKSDDDKSKRKDEKSGDKKDKDISEQKSSSNKTSQKDDKKSLQLISLQNRRPQESRQHLHVIFGYPGYLH
ncbi:uncharacterized protein LOC126764421 [Bactrocera neohumeralis]|uniref:uncharacterized protein LOC126764421 n=1 Tax=Bactrocera neohumeralis TaxID=98809 RepID=UPI0021667B94|nr:uncharacterized protein LOC126764421 [Bactrocera neohumeralis]